MGDDIGSGCVCFDFCRSAALHCWVCLKRTETILKDNMSLNPNRCHHPLITQLSWSHVWLIWLRFSDNVGMILFFIWYFNKKYLRSISSPQSVPESVWKLIAYHVHCFYTFENRRCLFKLCSCNIERWISERPIYHFDKFGSCIYLHTLKAFSS